MPRYFADDEINSKFVRRAQFGLARDLSEAEYAVMVAFVLGGKAGVVRHLAKTEEIEIIKENNNLARDFRCYLDDRHRQKSLHARSRCTVSARL